MRSFNFNFVPFDQEPRLCVAILQVETVLADLQYFCKGWGLSAKLGKHSAIWGKLGTALQAYTLNPCAKFTPNPISRKVNT